ncbi:tryptophan-rich sensory protein [Candidatus Parcubacteria bacterium]|nr:MAG: tryptophan-rich sensory protein [Candidatus Parcubacteria bacterium]
MRLSYIIAPVVILIAAFASVWILGLASGFESVSLPEWLFSPGILAAVWGFAFFFGVAGIFTFWAVAPQTRRFRWALSIFIINIGLNILWMSALFGSQLIEVSLGISLALFLSVIVLIMIIMPVAKLSSWLLVPYAGWTGFVAYLSYAILRLNR